jgi:hypothetical protein
MGIICVGVGIVIHGPTGYLAELATWLNDVGPTLSQGQFNVVSVSSGSIIDAWMINGNISIPFVLVRILTDDPGPGVLIPVWARIYLTVVQFGVPFLTVYLTRDRPSAEQAAMVLTAAVLAAPILRGGYLPLLAIWPAIAIGKRRLDAHRESESTERTQRLAGPTLTVSV